MVPTRFFLRSEILMFAEHTMQKQDGEPVISGHFHTHLPNLRKTRQGAEDPAHRLSFSATVHEGRLQSRQPELGGGCGQKRHYVCRQRRWAVGVRRSILDTASVA